LRHHIFFFFSPKAACAQPNLHILETSWSNRNKPLISSAQARPKPSPRRATACPPPSTTTLTCCAKKQEHLALLHADRLAGSAGQACSWSPSSAAVDRRGESAHALYFLRDRARLFPSTHIRTGCDFSTRLFSSLQQHIPLPVSPWPSRRRDREKMQEGGRGFPYF
jgi:hypothetical protein